MSDTQRPPGRTNHLREAKEITDELEKGIHADASWLPQLGILHALIALIQEQRLATINARLIDLGRLRAASLLSEDGAAEMLRLDAIVTESLGL